MICQHLCVESLISVSSMGRRCGLWLALVTVVLVTLAHSGQASAAELLQPVVSQLDSGIAGGGGDPPAASGGTRPSLGLPTFLQEPETNYYIVKNKPVTLTCKATHAQQLYFKCAGINWLEPSQHTVVELTDPRTNTPYLQSSIDVARHEVDQYFGDYWCECHAWGFPNQSEPHKAKSRRGLVEVAYLRRRFDREPLNAEVKQGSAVQLQCLPPDGTPPPEVFWMKDGEMIDETEINYIITNEGNLIINQARLSDTGNYTCGGENVVGRRLSESAMLTVYVEGEWSTWGGWSSCTSSCGKGEQRRLRTCSRPRPVNRMPCPGDNAQTRTCNTICKVNGFWSTWSSWSTCSPDCKHHRRRLCENPAPGNGGLHCIGPDLDSSNCTGGRCRGAVDTGGYNDADEVYNGATFTSEVERDNIPLYVGLVVALALFITILIVIIFVVRRKTRSQGTEDKKLQKSGQDGVVQPDITQTVVAIHNHNILDTPNNNHIGSSTSEKEAIFADNAINTNKSLLLDHSPAQRSDSKVSLKSAGGGDVNDARPASVYSDTANNRHSTLSCQLPSNIDAESLVWTKVTHAGGRITLPDSGVSLTIPEGAIKKGTTEDMFLAVSRDDKDRPRLRDGETVLGPVVVTGPKGLYLKKPVIVSFEHCASIKHGQWTVCVYSSDTPYDEPPQWQMASTLGQETLNTPLYTQLDLNHCHVMSELLTRYVLIGHPSMAGKAVKILRLACFAPAVPSSMDYNLRVYFVEDTPDALEGVMQVERKLGGRLLDKPKQMLFQHGGGNLCLAIEDLGPGWRCKLAANYQEIPFGHIWSGTQSGLHCSFALEHMERQHQILTGSIHAFQKSLINNRQVLTIAANLKENLPTPSPAHMNNKSLRHRNSTVTSTGCNSMVTLESPQHVFRLPSHIKEKLCEKLDPPNARGNDWRMLAQRLSVDRYINYFATKRSPTEHILDLWEARHREASAITDLMNSLRVMGRIDAAGIIEKEMGSWL